MREIAGSSPAQFYLGFQNTEYSLSRDSICLNSEHSIVTYNVAYHSSLSLQLTAFRCANLVGVFLCFGIGIPGKALAELRRYAQ